MYLQNRKKKEIYSQHGKDKITNNSKINIDSELKKKEIK
jgi:hypothetical protein